MTVASLEPHGFCMGVKAAIDKAYHALSVFGELYCLHPLVHNEQVVATLAAKGLRVVSTLNDIPAGGCVLLSAHGVSPQLRAELETRKLHVVDATCPFVQRAHRAVAAFAARGVPVVVVGNAEHAEVKGFVGEATCLQAPITVISTAAEVAVLPYEGGSPVGVVCQTTLAAEMLDPILEQLQARYPLLETVPASEACTATRQRQQAVKDFVAQGGDGVLVLGSRTSSNTAQLAACAQAAGARFVACVATPDEVRALDFGGVGRLGVTAGASTPEELFCDAVAALHAASREI